MARKPSRILETMNVTRESLLLTAYEQDVVDRLGRLPEHLRSREVIYDQMTYDTAIAKQLALEEFDAMTPEEQSARLEELQRAKQQRQALFDNLRKGRERK